MTTAAADREHALLDRLGHGDPDALHLIVERHAARLYRLAHGITRTPPDAEAVVQEVLAALVGGPRPAANVPLAAWLDREAVQAALARATRECGRAAPLEAWLPAYRADGHREGERAFVTADWSARSDAQLVAGGACDAVQDTVAALAPVDRAILLLADLGGHAAGVIGAAVGLQPETVRARLHRLRMALRERVTRTLTTPARSS